MDQSQAEQLTRELSGVFARRGMIIWAAVTFAQVLFALQDIQGAWSIPINAFVRPIILGLGVGAVLGTAVCALVVQFDVRRSMDSNLGFVITGGPLGAIQGLAIGSNLPSFLSPFIYPGLAFRPAEQRAIAGAVLGTLSCYLLAALCKRRVERRALKYRSRGM